MVEKKQINHKEHFPELKKDQKALALGKGVEQRPEQVSEIEGHAKQKEIFLTAFRKENQITYKK